MQASLPSPRRTAGTLGVAALIALVLADLAITPSRAQEPGVPQRRLQPIDWGDARRAMEGIRGANTGTLRAFRSAVPTGIDAVELPVLVPGTGPVRGTPRFRGQTTSYAATYALPDARLSVLGTAFALETPPGTPLEARGRALEASSAYTFTRSEDGADLDFERFGASYTLRLSCEQQTDRRCATDAFLRSLAESLIVAGGRFQ